MELPSRTELNFGEVVCLKCGKPCDFEETGGHRLFSKPDAKGRAQGYIFIRAYCHGDQADIVMTFAQAEEMRSSGRKIEVFGDIKMIDIPTACIEGSGHELADQQLQHGQP